MANLPTFLFCFLSSGFDFLKAGGWLIYLNNSCSVVAVDGDGYRLTAMEGGGGAYGPGLARLPLTAEDIITAALGHYGVSEGDALALVAEIGDEETLRGWLTRPRGGQGFGASRHARHAAWNASRALRGLRGEAMRRPVQVAIREAEDATMPE